MYQVAIIKFEKPHANLTCMFPLGKRGANLSAISIFGVMLPATQDA